MLVGAENFGMVVDISADQEVLVEQLAVPAVEMPRMVAAVLFVSERSWQSCHSLQVQAFHSSHRNSYEQGRVCCKLCRQVR